jgi:MoaA/NifB/PqqE/SkfB family radical SAM enzyme
MKEFKHTSWRHDTVLVEWDLGNECNQNCSYCPAVAKSGGFKNPDWDIVEIFAHKMLDHYDELGKRVMVNIGGSGEPTIVPWLPNLLRLLNNRSGGVTLSTNLSAPIDWWSEHANLIKNVAVTVHYEYTTLHEIREKLDLVAERSRNISVTVPMLPSRFHDQLADIEWFRNNTDYGPIPQIVFKNYTAGGEWIAYTEEQKETLRRYHNIPSFNVNDIQDTVPTPSPSAPKPTPVSTVVKTTTDVYLTEKDDQRCFTGWRCYAGIDTLCIDSRGYVRRGWCAQLGQTQTPMAAWTWDHSPVTCNMAWCRLGLDLLARKELA